MKTRHELTVHHGAPANQLVRTVLLRQRDEGIDALWLGELAALCAALGLGERCLRASLLRLSALGTVAGLRFGRRAAYCLTPCGEPARADALAEALAHRQQLDEVAQGYRRLQARCRAIENELSHDPAALSARAAWAASIALQHACERLDEADPLLPPHLLPPDWPADHALLQYAGALARLRPLARPFVDQVLAPAGADRPELLSGQPPAGFPARAG